MKKTHTHISRILTASLMLFMVSVLTLPGQTPTTFNYQAVLRDADGYINVDANVNIELEIHQGTASGAVAYSEVHSTTTSEFGLVNLEIGSVTPASFATIDWAAGPYFVEVSVDGIPMGVSELLTVPYALYAVNGVPGPQGDQGIQGEIGLEGPAGVIEANSVGSSHVIDNSLTAADLATNSVAAAEIAAGAVGSSEVANNSLTNADLLDEAGMDWVNINTTNRLVTSPTAVGIVTLNVPAAGYVIVTFAGTCYPDGGDRIVLSASNTAGGWGLNDGNLSVYGDDSYGKTFCHIRVYQVAAGAYSFYANAYNYIDYAGDGRASIYATLTAEYFPTRY